MRSSTLLLLSILIASCIAARAAQAHDHAHHGKMATTMESHDEKSVQKKCPVMGGDIDSSVFVDHEGQRIYFCCESCKAEFRKDPAKYLAKLKVESAAAEKSATLSAQKTCPVTGDPINKDLYVDADGKRIYVCCEGCIAPVKKDPQKYIDILKKRGEGVESIGK